MSNVVSFLHGRGATAIKPRFLQRDRNHEIHGKL
jgi:hypothetical protein